MIPDNVTLIVKAPNQQIEDQNVECQSSWTVQQLKRHLSEVYPNKPKVDEQKIIYSGQLLRNNIVLKDILRTTYDAQITYTVHLVCAPNHRMADKRPPNPPSQDGVRRRNIETPEVAPRPEMRQNDQNHTVEMQNYLSSFVNHYGRIPANNYGRVPAPYTNYNLREGSVPGPNNPDAMANHMMMMQAYRQYMRQYAIMIQATALPPLITDNQPPPAPAPGAPEEAGRDWLEHIYAASRLAVLSSLVYLYGSGARLLLVVLVCLAGYLYQIGFFHDLNLNPQRNQRPAGNNRPNQPPNGDNQPANDADQPGNNADQPANNQTDETENQQSLFAASWMIFVSFLTSLIPEANQ